MPIFNGGLFDETNAPLLKAPKIFNDLDLIYILNSLFNYQDTDTQNTLFRRDYRTLSVAHLGTIYEGLLSYFFAIAEEDLFYLAYEFKKNDKAESIEGYFDSYDYEKIAKSNKIHRQDSYKKGQIYLKNTSNSRKSSASFYTPDSITKFLVGSALKDKLNDNNILHFKILDNACGSGHFLVEALNQITQIIQEDFDSFPALKNVYEQEKQAVQNNICAFIKGYEADESDILKRLLLKRVIFGVDLNPFSIELTKLSLWVDSFIFGTPLSFLEHHIKCGNALIGSSIKNFTQYAKALQAKTSGLFMQEFLKEFEILGEVFAKLDSIKDTTEADIKESKRLYTQDITPSLEKLNFYLNICNARSFMNAQEQQLLSNAAFDLESLTKENLGDEYQLLRDCIIKYTKKFHFFNYEIEFPEIVETSDNHIECVGFQAIVGNPPWDKTKFSDSDFFPQFISNYRTLSKSGKNEVQENLLAKSYIKKEYEATKAFVNVQNEYYKAHFPLNAGSGDGNLFRFFVERNLSLLAPNASLNYVLPSALMLEEGSYALRKEILENKRFMYFYSFENREGIFNDVHRSYKFALMQVYNTKPIKTHKIKTMFYKTSIDEIYDKANIITLTLQDIKRLSPNQLALQEVRGQKDLETLKKCYKAYTPLNSLDMRRELDMTNDKEIFLDFRNELHMTNDKEIYMPLYEGKMINQFDAEFANPQYFLNIVDYEKRLRSKEIYRLKQDLGLDNKEYERLLEALYSKVSKERAEDSSIKYDREFYRLGFRAIASDTNERTLIFSLLPKNIGYGHTMYGVIPKRYVLEQGRISHKKVSYLRLLFALGIFNSLIVDFIARGMIQISVDKTYIKRIPLPQPSDKEILENPIYLSIVKNALILQLYNDKEGYFKELQKEFDIKQNEIPTTPKLYDELRAKQDIAIAKLYGLSKEEFCDILESFKVLQNKKPEYIVLLKSLWE